MKILFGEEILCVCVCVCGVCEFVCCVCVVCVCVCVIVFVFVCCLPVRILRERVEPAIALSFDEIVKSTCVCFQFVHVCFISFMFVCFSCLFFLQHQNQINSSELRVFLLLVHN